MSHPYIGICPYLSFNDVIEFAGWELGPLAAFEARWADPTLKAQASAFLSKFVDHESRPIEKPSLLCRHGGQIDGRVPSADEAQALQAAISFSFLDRNPRRSPSGQNDGWSVTTADNTDLYWWPIDLESGNVTMTAGTMVRTLSGGYRIGDPQLVIRPPLDLHTPLLTRTADRQCVDAVYRTVLQSLGPPGTNHLLANRLRVAIDWFVRAWRNTSTLHFPERLVFLKTAFEALTGTSRSDQSARALTALFEAIPNTASEDSERLIWAPTEQPSRKRTYTTQSGQQRTDSVTDLEHWFLAFADARNRIIHEGTVPTMIYYELNSAYNGHFVFTAEFLLRAVVKVSLAPFGYPELWRSETWRAIKAAWEEAEPKQEEAQSQAHSDPAS